MIEHSHHKASTGQGNPIDELKADEEAIVRNEPPASRSPMDLALERLRIAHLPFRDATQEELQELDELRLRILETVLAKEELADYYREAWNGIRPAVTTLSEEMVAHRLVATMQLNLMERAFYVLRLNRFASAPENSGWMELFRRWGSSPRFNRIFDEIDRTLTPSFTAFYLTYLRSSLKAAGPDHPERYWVDVVDHDAEIHHAWLARPDSRGRGLFMDSGLVESQIEMDVRPGTGGVDDPGSPPGPNRGYETPSDSDKDR